MFNTAVSSEWGFPKECPANCLCKEYDCNSKDFTKRCGFSEGFCEVMEEKPKMKVNWVRVYQDPRDPTQKVGCSTPERPTRQYIDAHQELYKQATDVSLFTWHHRVAFFFCGSLKLTFLLIAGGTTESDSSGSRQMRSSCYWNKHGCMRRTGTRAMYQRSRLRMSPRLVRPALPRPSWTRPHSLGSSR